MIDEPLISVIVPIYNIEQYLVKCLDSIINQTYRNLEIILVDDGSTDQSPEICDLFAGKDDRIRVIHKENGGLVSARKTGLKASRGIYISNVDGDDWLENNLYEVVYQKGLSMNADMVSFSHFRNYSEKEQNKNQFNFEEGKYNKKQIKEKILPHVIEEDVFFEWGMPLTMWSFIIKRQVLYPWQMQVNDRIRIGEDTACIWPCLLNADSISVVNKHLYHYRQRETSMIHLSNPLEYENIKICYEYLDGIMKEYDNENWEMKLRLMAHYWLLMVRYDLFLANNSDILFPYSNVMRESKIILYGAGTFGKQLYTAIKKENFCEIVWWVDKRYESYKGSELPIQGMKQIKDAEFDYVVIAVLKAGVSAKIKEELLNLGIPENKVALIDINCIRNHPLLFIMEKS